MLWKNERLCVCGLFLASLGTLGAILGTALHTAVDTLCIQCAADDVVTNAGEILNASASDHNDRVLLQVVANAGDIAPDFHTIGQLDTSDLS